MLEKIPLDIDGVWTAQVPDFQDMRGYLSTICNEDDNFNVKEVYIAETKEGYLRGLHFQAPPYVQSKLIYCIKGCIYDVIVDLRKHSPTYKKYISTYMDDKEKYILHVPAGCAHGYFAFELSQILYMMDKEFHPECYGGIHYDSIDVDWPSNLTTSLKDNNLPRLEHFETPFI